MAKKKGGKKKQDKKEKEENPQASEQSQSAPAESLSLNDEAKALEKQKRQQRQQQSEKEKQEATPEQAETTDDTTDQKSEDKAESAQDAELANKSEGVEQTPIKGIIKLRSSIGSNEAGSSISDRHVVFSENAVEFDEEGIAYTTPIRDHEDSDSDDDDDFLNEEDTDSDELNFETEGGTSQTSTSGTASEDIVDQLDDLKFELEKKDREIQRLKEENKAWETTVDELEQLGRDAVSRVTDELRKVEDELDVMRAKCEEAEHRAEKATDQDTDKDDKIEELQDEIDDLKTKMSDLEDEWKDKLEDAEERESSLRERLDAAEDENTKLEDKIKELEEGASGSGRRRNSSISSSGSTESTDKAEHQTQIDDLKQQLQHSEEKRRALEAEMDKNQQVATDDNEKLQLQKEVARLKDELLKVQRDASTPKQQQQSPTDDNEKAQLRAEVAQLQEKVNKLEESDKATPASNRANADDEDSVVRKLEKQIHILKYDLKEKTAKIEDLTQELLRTRSLTRSTSASTLPSVAIASVTEKTNNKQPHSHAVIERDPAEFLAYNDLTLRPAQCDTSCLESYLSDDDFETVFGMPKNAFYAMAKWRRDQKKRQVKLF